MESIDPSIGANKGLEARARYCAESREIHLLGGDFSLKVLRATLFIFKKVSVSPAVRLGHSQAVMKGNALYPLQRITMETFSIPGGSRICSQENLFLGPLPRYMVIGLVDHTSNTGSLH